MKMLILTLLTFSSLVASAVQKNPQIRTCHILGGEFLTADTANDQVGFCRLDTAIIGALDLMLFNNKEAISQSVNNYMKNQTSCEAVGQIQNLVNTGTEEVLKVCSFADGSYIELNTLTRGSHSPDNSKLNQVLGL